MSNTQYQTQYWNQLVEVQVHVSYLYHYASQSERWDRYINIFLAITSSGSIAAWAVWLPLMYLWAVLIAISQVITAVKTYLPFKQRQKANITIVQKESGWNLPPTNLNIPMPTVNQPENSSGSSEKK